MSKLSKTEQIIAEKTVCVLLVRGQDPHGNGIYAYVAVRADKLEEFMEAQRKGLFYPEEHGLVLASGQGEPAQDVKDRMTREYGFNNNTMMDIPDPAQAHQITTNLREYEHFQHKPEGEE